MSRAFSTLTFSSAVVGVMLACSMSHDNPLVDAAPATPNVDAPNHATADAAAEPVVDRGRVRTADTDAEQLDAGSFSLSARSPMTDTVKIANGPFVLTDFVTKTSQTSWVMQLFTSNVQECTLGSGGFSQTIDPNDSFHGTKLFVKTGQFLCVSLFSGDVAFAGITWAGFHPYAAP